MNPHGSRDKTPTLPAFLVRQNFLINSNKIPTLLAFFVQQLTSTRYPVENL